MPPSTTLKIAQTAGDVESTRPEVVVVGAGPAGLMLAANLVRFGIRTDILDERSDRTNAGRADGLQPKSIETLKQMRLAEPLVRKGARIYDICFWSSRPGQPLHRTARDIHFPPVVDVLDPFILLVHQGMVEEIFLDDLATHGVRVRRNATYLTYEEEPGSFTLHVKYNDFETQSTIIIQTAYLVGCDGAHSEVRKSIPGLAQEGGLSQSFWGVLDGVLDTDFPDIWSKVVLYSEAVGSVLCIPRERGMTRLYIELRGEDRSTSNDRDITEAFVMSYAKKAFEPYRLAWETIEWFGVYKIGQRIASHFSNQARTVFIAGDASHTHSPKAAQGMNTSIHDSLNLAWKLNLVIRGLATDELLSTYEIERKKIAHDLINFDYEHAKAFHDGDAEALAANFLTNIRFISGVGVEYGRNSINTSTIDNAGLKPGKLLIPAKATRYIDSNPVDLQLDIPMLGQFRVYFVCPSVKRCLSFLTDMSTHVQGLQKPSILSRVIEAGRQSYKMKPRSRSESDAYILPQRYTPISDIFTFALITATARTDFEISELPTVFLQSRWTVYLDDVPHQDTRRKPCHEKWIGTLDEDETAIVNIRPDGYVGSLRKWQVANHLAIHEAKLWLDAYYGGFMRT